MIDLIYNLFFAVVISIGTIICGIPIIFRFVKNGRWITKLVLSFVVGFIVLSLTGIAANALSIDSFITELCVLIICIVGIFPLRNTLAIEMDRNDRIVIGLAMFYSVILIAFFNWIIMWMAGDAIAHASIIRMLIDGETIPVSIYPFGTYWDYYPKAFHFYSFFWAKGSSVLTVIQIIPVLISAVTPVILYSILRELKQETVAVYAFVFACICFPAHYAYLIWAGYPSMAAEMILIAATLSLIVNWRLIPLFFIGLLFTHTRFVGYLMLILLLYVLYLFYESCKNKLNITPKIVFATLTMAFLGVFAICLHFQLIHPPQYLLSLVSDRTLATEFMSRWFWAIIAVFGMVIALFQRKKTYQIFILWFIAVFILLILVDTSVLNFFEAPDRIISLFYIPFSVFAALLLGTISDSIPESKGIFLGLLVIIGFICMGAIFYNYSTTWAIPKEDYNAIIWLEHKNYEKPVCINVDDTGAWIYPLAGIEVVQPMYIYGGPAPTTFSWYTIQHVITDPNSESTISELKNSHYNPVLIFISNITLSRPNYTPPFSRYNYQYPSMKNTFNSTYYNLIYDKNVEIFSLKPN